MKGLPIYMGGAKEVARQMDVEKEKKGHKPQAVRFFEVIFPWRSFVELRFIRNGEIHRTWIPTHEVGKILATVNHYTKQRWNSYYGVASRKRQGGGTKTDLDYVNAVWIDVDTDKEGLSKEVVVEKLLNWILPPSIIVDSGHGVHCYWLLREPAKDFKLIERINLGLAKELGGDTRAYDATRILRVPGTTNWKDPSNPVPVRIIHFDSDRRYNLLTLDDWSVEIEEYDMDKKLTVEKQFDNEIVDRVVEECAFLKHCKEDARTLDEPSWYCMITNLTALGAIEKIHELSKPYYKPPNRYTKEETDKKIQHALRDAFGPHTCAYIQNVLGFKCPQDCPWRGKVKSPAGIAWKLVKKTPELPFSVLGFTPKREVLFWYRGRIIAIPARQLTRDELTLFLGNLEKEEFRRVKNTILTKAYEKGIIDVDETYKTGIWKVENGFLLISGKDVLHITDLGIRRIREPVYEGKILNLDGKPWIDPERLEEYLPKANITDVFIKLRDLIAQWNFENGEMIPYLTAFVMLVPFQQAMKWRPWIYITGRRGTGKTTLFQEVLGIYGNLVVRMDKTTAHALAQEIGSTGKIPILDEFEKYRKLEEILELAKLANAGGFYTRGTTGEKMKKWSLHHIFWFASVYLAGSDSAQRSRMVVFELLPHEDIKPQFLTLKEKEELRHQVIACMLKHWNEIEERAFEYLERKAEFNVKDGRIIDNFAYASALVDVATGEGGIPEFAERIDFEEDEEEILRAILFTIIENETLLHHLENHASLPHKYGVKKITRKDGSEALAIDPQQVRRYLLKDTQWKDMDITKPLLRLTENHKKESVWIGGKSTWAVVIPWETVKRVIGSD
ncbi:MAG: hypothetical protein DRP25_02895 [Thermotoga sp.]|nr:MAG: hypothetical protein DRP25_02895 [Thermotoga sp.]